MAAEVCLGAPPTSAAASCLPVTLWNKANTSFLHGASHPEELVEQAHAYGYDAMALTDRHGLYGMVRAHTRAKKLGIKLIVGAEVCLKVASVSAFDVDGAPEGLVAKRDMRVVLLAPTRKAYTDLCQLLSVAQGTGPKGHAALDVDLLCARGTELLCLCPHPSLLARLQQSMGDNLWALCARAYVAQQKAFERHLQHVASDLSIPIVAAIEVLYHVPQRRALQDVLTCIEAGTTLNQATALLRPNAEHALLSPKKLADVFADRPSWLEQTRAIADRCQFAMSSLRYRYPLSRLPQGHTTQSHLEAQVNKGAQLRYGRNVPQKAKDLLARELKIIASLDYGGYFLSMHDIVMFCQENKIVCQGRGSAANSVVCYCLQITAVDPVQMDLLFERFVSKERQEPPDIDLDIEHQRREEVIQWVYNVYGRRHAAMVANVVRFRLRSAIRQVGKVLGLNEQALDAMAKRCGHGQGGGTSEGFVEPIDLTRIALEVGLDIKASAVAHLMRLSLAILDFPRHLSVHPGGFVLGDEPVDTLSPIEPASMEGRTVIQWDKQDVEDLGLFKVDLLGLGALSQVRRAFDLIASAYGRTLDMATVPQEDPETYAMLSQADTVGVFQVESRAQMSMLPRLRPKTYYDLVVEVAIVRPGPIQGDMVHPYLKQRQLKIKPTYPHPTFAPILDKTYGVPIFQEQVMKLAIMAADYTPDQADQLRRDMAAWRSQTRLEAHHQRIIDGMLKKGVPHAFAERIFDQIRGFGEYGFPESHAASFALIVYVTAWLRCHYPTAFCCALLNAQPMGFYSPATIVEDARRHGVVVLPLDINQSAWACTLVPYQGRFAVRMGLCYVKGWGTFERHVLTQEPPPFSDLHELVGRTRLSADALWALAKAGGLDALWQHTVGDAQHPSDGCQDEPTSHQYLKIVQAAGAHAQAHTQQAPRRHIIWTLRRLLKERGHTLPLRACDGVDDASTRTMRKLSPTEAILWDLQHSHHSTRGHALMGAPRLKLRAWGVPDASQVQALPHGRRVEVVGWVICRQRPGTAHGVTFLTLEDETGFINVVIWQNIFLSFASLIKTASVLGVAGRTQKESGVQHVVAEHVFVPKHTLWAN